MIDKLISPHIVPLVGTTTVKRLLPRGGKGIGPFLFLDHFGPWVHEPGSRALDVPPHPHIGLSTLTYLFEGESVHRDNLGNTQPIRPGEINWMTAGSGVAHSERVSLVIPQRQMTLHGLQAWVALPNSSETVAPAFEHLSREQVPSWSESGVIYSLLAGEAFGRKSPVSCYSKLFYVRVESQGPAQVRFEADGQEAGFYLMSGRLSVGEEAVSGPQLIQFKLGASIELNSTGPIQGVFLGGVSVGPRLMNWNFVASSRELIAQARDHWKQGRFGLIEGETESIALPEGDHH